MKDEEKPKDKIVIPPVDPKIVVVGHGYALRGLEGIRRPQLDKLKESGIRSLQSLLRRAATQKNRRDIAGQVGVTENQILGWVNRADKLRVPGVGIDYAALLESAGVDTVRELARRNPENLHIKIVETNEEKHLVRRLPAKKQVEEWVTEAKKLPKVVEY